MTTPKRNVRTATRTKTVRLSARTQQLAVPSDLAVLKMKLKLLQRVNEIASTTFELDPLLDRAGHGRRPKVSGGQKAATPLEWGKSYPH
jgi:hypothetical protein